MVHFEEDEVFGGLQAQWVECLRMEGLNSRIGRGPVRTELHTVWRVCLPLVGNFSSFLQLGELNQIPIDLSH
jgi:hypothetical protein